MTGVSIKQPYPIFNDADGQPLEAGYIWVGQANLDPQMNPVNVYWDSNLTVPASQPIRTIAGYASNNGTPGRIYTASDFSIRVTNKKGSTVYSALSGSESVGQLSDASNITYTPAGTGAVATTVKLKLDQFVSVKDFGAKGDGVSNDTSAIQLAIDSFSDLGGKLYFPKGEYVVSAPITLNSPISLIGDDGGTVILTSAASGNVLVLSPALSWNWDSGISIYGINFKGSVARTAGAYIYSSNAYYVDIDRCQFINGFDALKLTGPSATGFYIRNCIFANNTNENVFIDANTGTQGPVDVVLDNLYIHGASPSSQSVSGVRVHAAGDVVLRHVSTVWAGVGLRITPVSGMRIQAMVCENCFFDSGSGYGIYMDTAGGGTVDLIKFVNTWVATNNLGGVAITGTGLIKQADFLNCVISNNNGHGVLLNTTNATNVSVCNSSLSANTQNGIFVAAGVSNFKILGNTIGPSGEFGGNGQWGVYISSGASNNYIISNNNLSTNTVGPLFDSGSGSSKITYPNLGATTAITPNLRSTDGWGIDFTLKGYEAIGAGNFSAINTGSGLVLIHNDSTGDLALFLVYAGGVTKVSGSATIVAGAPAANQLGVSYDAGLVKYKVTNGYAGVQNVYINLIKTRTFS